MKQPPREGNLVGRAAQICPGTAEAERREKEPLSQGQAPWGGAGLGSMATHTWWRSKHHQASLT